MKEKVYLKELLLNAEKVNYLAELIYVEYPKFNKIEFTKSVLNKFPELELKERITWIEINLEKYIPESYEKTLEILLNSLLNSEETADFIFAAFSEFVQRNGCNEEKINISLNTLGEFTKYFSSEFAIRDFINNFPEITFEKFIEWSLSNNVNQRRLASEGLRQKLPWAKNINFDYKRAAEILDNLFYDNSRYVVRSVANHLNDITKLDINFVIEILKKWKSQNRQNPDEMNYLILHSLRTAIKKGDPKTFEFLGYNLNPDIKIKNFTIANNMINLGDYLEFSFEINANDNEDLMIDYKIIYPKGKNGKNSEKVFKIKKTSILKNDIIIINKKYQFRKMTTKKLYSGNYIIRIQINGKTYCEQEFSLKIK